MARDFQVTGPCIVKVKSNGPLARNQGQGGFPGVWELGLTSDQISITPVYYHKDIHPDDYGPGAPAEVMTNLQEIRVKMNLVHYDEDILFRCWTMSMGGSPAGLTGVMAGAGALLGNGKPMFVSGNNFISLSIDCTDVDKRWRFPSSYITPPGPIVFPIGTERTVATVNWRCIPYVMSGNRPPLSGELTSFGALLFDNETDVDGFANDFFA
jgi:hypothetical protein